MTKNLLLGSTALVGAIAMAAPALADIEVTLSGQVEFGAKAGDTDTNADGSNRGYFFFMDSETKIQAEGAADNGINYSAKVELETDADIQELNADETVLAFWGGFGRVELGRDDGAEDVMYVGGEDFQAGTGGIDGDSTNLDLANINDSNDAAKITYFTPRVGGFQAGVSFTPDEDDEEAGANNGGFEKSVGLGLNYEVSAGGADVTLSGVYITADNETNGGEDKEDYAIGVGVEFAGLGIGAGYVIRDDGGANVEGDGFNLGVKYGFGPANVSVGYSYDTVDDFDGTIAGDQDEEVGVLAFAADYKLFPGVKVKGDIAFNDNDIDTNDGNNNFDKTTAGVVTIQVDY